MYKNKKILCIVPARSGSKGLKNKNILKIKNKELLYYPITAAKNSKYVDYILFSSDSKKFIKIAKRYKASCPFVRPKKFSTDNSTSFQVIKHGLDFLKKNENKTFDFIVCLEPTSPLTSSKDLDKSIRKIINSKSKSLLGVMRSEKYSIPYHFNMNKNNLISPVVLGKNFKKRRQLVKNTFILDGSLYIADVKEYLKHKGFFTSKTIGEIMPKIKNFEIDDNLDYKIIKNYLED
tara:strand:- start:349 stop:1050 length:702 start_codon:yes stop_codon:yes gene_type:complete